MGKRSDFQRNPRDYYPTPEEAVLPLIPHVKPWYKTFSEPCAGDGRLSEHLYRLGGLQPYWQSDIEPQSSLVHKHDALILTNPLEWADCIITNPPWDRKILHPMIEHFRKLNHTWLLFDADWMHTKQSSEHMKYCKKIVSVGRVKWIPESKMTGKDNCCWYLFIDKETQTEFVGRKPKELL